MSKVVRLNEKDIERLVRKIISEEKSLNENKFFDWVRGKRFSDEETARNVLQGVQAGEAKDVIPLSGERMMAAGTRGSLLNKREGFEFFLSNHKISAEDRLRVSPSYGARHDYFLFVDDVRLDVSENIVKKIIKELQTPTSKKMDLKTSLSRYNLPKEERQKIEDPGTYFPDMNEAEKKKKWIQKVQKGIEKKGTEGSFKAYCGGEVTKACIDKAMKSGDTKLIRKANYAKNIKGYKGAKHKK